MHIAKACCRLTVLLSPQYDLCNSVGMNVECKTSKDFIHSSATPGGNTACDLHAEF